MRCAYLAVLSMSALAALAPGHARAAPEYTFTTLNVPSNITYIPYNIPIPLPLALNNSGQIVGQLYDPHTGNDGFIRNPDGTYTTVYPKLNSDTFASGINNAGEVVGYYGPYSNTAGFTRDPAGHITTLTLPNNDAIDGVGRINNAGQIVGGTVSGRAFVISLAGTYFSFTDPAAGATTGAQGINDAGEVVGVYSDANGAEHGFLRDAAGNFTNFDAPGAVGLTVAYGINNSGNIVGTFGDGSGHTHGFLRDASGVFTTIDAPNGAADTNVFDINDSGEIVGAYDTAYSRYINYGFFAMPVAAVPEPASLSLLGAGLFGVGLLRRRLKA